MAIILVTDKSGLVMGKIEAKAGMVTRHNRGIIVRSTAKAVFTDKPTVRLHGMRLASDISVEYSEVASDPTFTPCGFLSQGSADRLRTELTKGKSVHEVAKWNGTYVATVRTVLAAYPAA
jgi:hypothetical protein